MWWNDSLIENGTQLNILFTSDIYIDLINYIFVTSHICNLRLFSGTPWKTTLTKTKAMFISFFVVKLLVVVEMKPTRSNFLHNNIEMAYV